MIFYKFSVSESISTVSVNELSVLDGEVWDPGCSSVGIGQKLHKEFTRKIQVSYICVCRKNTVFLSFIHSHIRLPCQRLRS